MGMKYYLIDDEIIVRYSPGMFERYVKSKGIWVVDQDMVGIFTGKIPFYDEITEAKALELIAKK